MEDGMSKHSWLQRLSAALIVLIVGFVGIAIGPSAARAYCNPNHQAWDPCYDSTKAKPPQEAAHSPCAAFTKHWGHVPQTTGYRHRIAGVYCSAREIDTADDSLNQLLGSIEPSS